MSAYFQHDQLVGLLEQQLARIETLESTVERLTQLLDEHDDEITSIQLLLHNGGPSAN